MFWRCSCYRSQSYASAVLKPVGSDGLGRMFGLILERRWPVRRRDAEHHCLPVLLQYDFPVLLENAQLYTM